LERYPDEIALADQLRFTRNKLALVDGIVDQARAHERAGEWHAALEKWASLLAVHEKYPGLNAEIERVRRARENARTPQQPNPARPREIARRPGEATFPVPQTCTPAPADQRPLEAPTVTEAKPTGSTASKGRQAQLIAAGVTAVILTGGVVAYRSRPNYAPVTLNVKTPAQPVLSGTPPPAPKASDTAPPPRLTEPPRIVEEKSAKPPARVARLEIAGVPAAVVKVDGRPVGETDANGAFQRDLPPGNHTIEIVKDDYSPASIKEGFRAGGIVRLDHNRVAMARLAKPAPPPPDPKLIDAQEWATVANSSDPEEFEAFIRNHPSGAHLDQARARAADLRQQVRARAAQQAEQSAWEKVDQNNREQLQDYVSRFPSGAHAQQSRARMAEIDRQAAEALANQRLREQQAQKDQESAKRAADMQAIGKLLADFDAAYNHRNLAGLQKMWPGVPVNAYRKQFRDAKDLKFQLQLVGQPEVSGNSGTALCVRTLNYRGQAGGLYTQSERVKLHLAKEGSGWLIRSIELD
jgi:hypothetical protein